MSRHTFAKWPIICLVWDQFFPCSSHCDISICPHNLRLSHYTISICPHVLRLSHCTFFYLSPCLSHCKCSICPHVHHTKIYICPLGLCSSHSKFSICPLFVTLYIFYLSPCKMTYNLPLNSHNSWSKFHPVCLWSGADWGATWWVICATCSGANWGATWWVILATWSGVDWGATWWVIWATWSGADWGAIWWVIWATWSGANLGATWGVIWATWSDGWFGHHGLGTIGEHIASEASKKFRGYLPCKD